MTELLRLHYTTAQSWVSATRATWPSANRLLLDISVRNGRRGRVLGSWCIEASGVLEYRVSDVNGGGLRIYGRGHPTVKQHHDQIENLAFSGAVANRADLMGQLWAAHYDLVDDWIPVERYLAPPEQLLARLARGEGRLTRGPRFLMRCYERVLRRNGLGASRRIVRPASKAAARVLHFGSSFVIARQFTCHER